MKIVKRAFFLLIFLSGLSLFAQGKELDIKNRDFEEQTGWRSASGNNDFSYSGDARAGKHSLLISHSEPSGSCIVSEEVKLKVGNLYKLSGMIKTENAFTDGGAQYPTPVAACITMESFPFTNNSQSVGGTSGWQKVEAVFFATQGSDKVALRLGYNGAAAGKAWFDDIKLEEIDNISEFVSPETVKWFGEAFRFDYKGWIYLHIEGEPYKRGVQYGYLAADEIKEFINKLAINKNNVNPMAGWNDERFMADALFLRKFDAEYLEEMKGIADGVNKAGVKIFNRQADLIDIAALNSSIDISYSASGLKKTPNPLTGKSFLSAEDDQDVNERLHKCSSFLASKSATESGRIVFSQLFMWGGYTGPHWNLFVDLIPSSGNRLVYETFPGGINSGADFYINSKGIMIGETTVNQTPFDANGSPQANRIRKAAQYANNIDDVVKIMTTDNNGLYTNDWLIGDAKTDEIAVLILGTKKYKLWRSSQNDFYNGQKDWYFSNNNNKSAEVRKEYIANDDNAPYDITYRPMDRDITFWNFYEKNKGKINVPVTLSFMNSSPINRPHACDGKVTTSEMAEKMVFLANYGKVTLREAFVNENGRIPDLPGAIPRLSLGYAVFSPLFIAEKMRELKQNLPPVKSAIEKPVNLSDVKDVYSVDKNLLWHNTVYPASDKENWLNSGSAAYWNLLNSQPAKLQSSFEYTRDELTEINCRYLYTVMKEGVIPALEARQAYDGYKYYQLPRIKGTYLLHQLRLKMGNSPFLKFMNRLYDEFREKEVTNDKFVQLAEKESGINSGAFIRQWLERNDIPDVQTETRILPDGQEWKIEIEAVQNHNPYLFLTTVTIETEKELIVKKAEINAARHTIVFNTKDKPVKITFNSGNDIPLSMENIFTFSNFYDDFNNSLIIYGTKQQIEANHTLALRFSKTLADRFTEILLPVKKESEVDEKELAGLDLIVLGGAADNKLAENIAEKIGFKTGKNFFSWRGKTYSEPDDGILITVPNPFNPSKGAYLFYSNSALQLYMMTKTIQRMPGFAVFKGDRIIEKGY
jgi:hypothetical protein